jgi:hypothetical protein
MIYQLVTNYPHSQTFSNYRDLASQSQLFKWMIVISQGGHGFTIKPSAL